MTLPQVPARPPRVGAWIADRVLGSDPVDRRLIKRSLLSGAVYAAALLGEALGVFFGFADAFAVACLSVYMVIGTTAFYAIQRSGLNRHFDDRSMTLPQIAFASSALLFSYPINGPYRGLSLLAVAVPPLFGLFTLGRRQGLALVASVPLAFGPMMLGWV